MCMWVHLITTVTVLGADVFFDSDSHDSDTERNRDIA